MVEDSPSAPTAGPRALAGGGRAPCRGGSPPRGGRGLAAAPRELRRDLRRSLPNLGAPGRGRGRGHGAGGTGARGRPKDMQQPNLR